MYKIILYYKFALIENVPKFWGEHRRKCRELGLRGRVYIAREGINGTLCATEKAIEAYKNFLWSLEGFKETSFKEDLYNEVLHRISQRLVEAIAQGVDQAAAPAARFEDTIMAIYNVAVNNGLDSKVLLRELLDDQRRDAPEDQWYFRQFLGHLVGMLDVVEGQAGRPFADKLAAIYALMSAIQFFTASGAVLRRFYGEPKLDEIRVAYAGQLRSEIRRMIADTV